MYVMLCKLVIHRGLVTVKITGYMYMLPSDHKKHDQIMAELRLEQFSYLIKG